jgi:class 3 adenylate cyclase
MAATRAETAFILGHCNGGPAALQFAATFPERALGLVLCSTFAKGCPDTNHPGALSADAYAVAVDVLDHWGEGRSLYLYNPSRGNGALYRHLYASFERAALSRSMARAAIDSTLEIDVTSVLASVQVPTLVLHCTDDYMSIDAARYLASNIPDATLVELPGAEHAPFSGMGSDKLVDLIADFVTGGERPVEATPHRFGTILFTDIVGSTGHVAERGDVEWRKVLTTHEVAVRDEVDGHGGECVKSTGDGFLATFDSSEHAIRCADAIGTAASNLGIEIRSAVHAGSFQTLGQDIAGLAVHIAARLLDITKPSETLVSSPVKQLVAGTGLEFESCGTIRLKGVPEPCATFALIRESLLAVPAEPWRAEDPTEGRALKVHDRALVLLSQRTPKLARAVGHLATRG